MRPALLDLRPRAARAGAVAARADLRRAAGRIEDDGHGFPVALVRLPVVRTLRHEGAPDVEGVEEPVLERDPPVLRVEDGAVGDRRGGLVGVVVALERGESVARRAAADVVAAAHELGVGDEALDVRRRRSLGRVEHDDGRVPGEQRRGGRRLVFQEHKLIRASRRPRKRQNEPGQAHERGEAALVFL